MACLRKALLLLATVLVLAKSQICPPPTQSQISSSLRMVLISLGGESSTITVDLQDYHFTCQAVAAHDMYRSLSVAVQYTVAGGTTSAVQYSQFQLECATGTPNFYQLPGTMPFEGGVSPSLLSATTRRDCRFCTGATTGPAGLDTTANCFACSETCMNMGQGACAGDGTTCCPFFTTDGSCTTACPTNHAASNDTNYTCACAFPCALGHEPNTACTGCDPVHICLTSNPCQNGATCVIGTNSNTNYTCSCPSIYGGDNCTECVLSCSPGHEANSGCTMCDPVHICLTSNPCQNGATCNIGTASNTDYTCSCPPSYSGQNCDQCILSCPLGHEANSACVCVPVHICLTGNPCQNGATCNIGTTNTDYTCSCPPNYSGQNCDISQCTLSCPLGFESNQACTGCVPVHICATNNPCQNGATCVIGTNTDYTCSCPANFTGQNCEICDLPCPIAGYEPASTCTGECVPVHICLTSNPCQNGATCNIGVTNTDYTCSCVSPFTDKNCSTRGTPCSPNPCQNDGRCSSLGEGYSCTCVNSWRGANCTECNVTNCTLCSQSTQGCETCNIGFNPENLQCTAITPAMILPWWVWVLIALGIVLIIFFLILVPVLMVWYCKNRKLDKPEVEKDKELKEKTYI